MVEFLLQIGDYFFKFCFSGVFRWFSWCSCCCFFCLRVWLFWSPTSTAPQFGNKHGWSIAAGSSTNFEEKDTRSEAKLATHRWWQGKSLTENLTMVGCTKVSRVYNSGRQPHLELLYTFFAPAIFFLFCGIMETCYWFFHVYFPIICSYCLTRISRTGWLKSLSFIYLCSATGNGILVPQ